MEWRIRNQARRTLRAVLRGAAAVALAAKFLVPVGYMPASLADGGPIRLCDAGSPAVLAAPSEASGRQAGLAQLASSSNHAAAGHGHDEPSADHSGWERCSLGGLASLAAIAGDWHVALPRLQPALVAAADSEPLTRRTVVPFRSRAPPLALS